MVSLVLCLDKCSWVCFVSWLIWMSLSVYSWGLDFRRLQQAIAQGQPQDNVWSLRGLKLEVERLESAFFY